MIWLDYQNVNGWQTDLGSVSLDGHTWEVWFQLTDSNNNFYCYVGRWTSGVAIPTAQFNTRCWDNSGTFATSSLLFKRVDILVPSNAPTDAPFAYCLTNVSVE